MYRFLDVNLSMFDGESAVASTGSEPVVAAAPQTSSEIPVSKPKVVYGKTDEPQIPIAQGDSEAKPDKESYAKFKEQYKDFFHTDVTEILKDRFKKVGAIEKDFGVYEPIVKVLMEKYGVKTANDLKAQLEEERYQNFADEKGYTLEEAKEFLDVKRENEQLKAKQHELEIQKNLNEWYRQADEIRQKNNEFDIDEWSEIAPFMESLAGGKTVNDAFVPFNTQVDETKQAYPEFDVKKWIKDAQFLKLVNAYIPIKMAYEVCNIDGIKANTAKKMEQNVLSNIKAKGQIKENGLSGSPAIVFKSDVSKLTAKDRRDIAERVKNGEKIVF